MIFYMSASLTSSQELQMNTHTLRVGIDVGSTRHRVAVGLPDGKLIIRVNGVYH